MLILQTSVFILCLGFAWWFLKTGYMHNLIGNVLPFRFIAEILAGVFYTSFLTSPLSLGMLVVLGESNNPVITAMLAGLGAILGDLLIIKIFRDRLSSDFKFLSKRIGQGTNFLKRFHLDFIIPFIGAIIVASPLPDELGLIMLGVSKLKYGQIALLSYVLNTAGILLILIPINLLS